MTKTLGYLAKGVKKYFMRRYLDLSTWLKTQFGAKIFKVSLSAETTCPNIDGTLAVGGCTFCNDAAYSPMNHRRAKSIPLQLEEGMEYIRKRHHSAKFIAYFQSFTSTYGDRNALLSKFRASLDHPDVVGFALSTRPDSIDEKWGSDLSELVDGKMGWIEVGLQTANDITLARINRWHTKVQFCEALQTLYQKSSFTPHTGLAPHMGLPVCAHVVLGLPGETRKDILETAYFLASQPIWGLKIHNLHVVKGTALADDFRSGIFKPLSLEEFAEWTVDFLELTPPSVLIHRINAHAPRHLTLAPEWSVNKLAVFNAVEAELKRRDSWQGKALGFPHHLCLA